MFVNKYLSRVYQSGIFVVLGIVFCASLVNASSQLKSHDEFSQQYIDDEPYTFKEEDLLEGGVEVEYPDTADIKSEEIAEVVLNIKGMTCSKCEETLKAALVKCDGIQEVNVSHSESHAVIKVNVFEVDFDEVVEVVKVTGFSVAGEE